jgi:hypothetical protein
MKATNETLDNLARPLRAFWVGLAEIYAAYSAKEALKPANHEYGQVFFSIDDVQRCKASTLEALPTRQLAPAWARCGSE